MHAKVAPVSALDEGPAASRSPRPASLLMVASCWSTAINPAAPMRLTHTEPAQDIHAFRITRWQGEPGNAAPDEHDDVRWFSPTELTGLKLPPSCPDIVNAIRTS